MTESQTETGPGTEPAPWVLPIALDETTRPVLRPLPLRDVGAPPRLVAHLRAVHDVGKALHRGELSGPGSDHEAAGRDPDTVLTAIGDRAEERLAYQMGFPVAAG